MKNKRYKIIVAHPEQQHSYRLASALKFEGLLFKYITTVYDKDSSIVMRILKKIISSESLVRAKKRKNPDLLDCDVIQFYEISGYLNILLNRIDKKRNVYNFWRKKTADRFGRKVAFYAIKNNVDAVIMYDLNAEVCFKILKEVAPNIKRILDTSAANRVYMKNIYESDLIISPEYSELLKSEIDYLNKPRKLLNHEKEIQLSSYFLVGSSFVKRTLEYSGIDDRKIYICPYGVDKNLFSLYPRKIKDSSEAIDFVFVGGTKQLKGVSYLLSAFEDFNPNQARLTIIGNCSLPERILNKYKDKITFTGNILQSKVAEILKKMDVMIFPSLGEGMSLSILEAMSTGLLVIASTNSGTNDFIYDGVNGFVIPIQNVEAIKNKISWCINNRSRLTEIGFNAYETTKTLSWESYYVNVSKAIYKILNDEI